MLELDTAKLESLGAEITTREIRQQPELWGELAEIIDDKKSAIDEFLEQARSATEGKLQVIFTGSGTSEYVGNAVVPYLKANGDTGKYDFVSVAATDLVAAPEQYLDPQSTPLVISFARSGNSPESLAAVDVVTEFVADSFHLAITCAPEGNLATTLEHQENACVLLMPSRSNDAGFAMTGSYSCMLLASLLIFDTRSAVEKKSIVKTLIEAGQDVLERESEITAFLGEDVDRIVYLGSATLRSTAQEARLKILELTAGKVVALFDSSMGFRHGPKSFINNKTVVFGLLSNNAYTRQYDIDILREIAADEIAQQSIILYQGQDIDFSGQAFKFIDGEIDLPDGYLGLAQILVAQLVALNASVKVGNTPDTPSATGTVNRVVKGVVIHPLTPQQ